MLKRVSKLSWLVLLALAFQLLTVPAIADNGISVHLDGAALLFDVPPQIIDDRTMVPMRKIFEEMGAQVDWDENTRTVTAVKNKTTIVMQINNFVMTVDGKNVTLDVPPQLINDRTLVPVRAVAQGLQAQVEWEEATKTVLITTAEQMLPTPSPTVLPSSQPDSAATPFPSSETVYYEINGTIPDYAAVTGAELKMVWEPEGLIRIWQYIYSYNANDLKKYTDCIEKLGFQQTHGGSQPYYSNGVEGLFICYEDGKESIYICLYSEGTAEKAITSKTEKVYLENTSIPNCGYLLETDPLRFDAGYTAAGDEIALYTYALPNIYSIKYEQELQAQGWTMAGGTIDSGGGISKKTYIKDGAMMGVVVDKILETITVSFSITNQKYSKAPAAK